MLRKIEDKRREQQRMRWLDGIIESMDMSLSKLQEILKEREMAFCSPWGHKLSDRTDQLNNINCYLCKILKIARGPIKVFSLK